MEGRVQQDDVERIRRVIFDLIGRNWGPTRQKVESLENAKPRDVFYSRKKHPRPAEWLQNRELQLTTTKASVTIDVSLIFFFLTFCFDGISVIVFHCALCV